YRQENINSFTDVTASAALPANILNAKYSDVRTFDFDLDGDLDLLLDPNPVTTQPVVLRNNGDGTFKELFPFEKLREIRHFAVADIDGDGDPDLAIVDQSGFKVLENERLGQYRERPVPQNLGAVIAIAAADINSDGTVDFVLMNRDGQILRLSDKGAGKDWEVAEIARVRINPTVSDSSYIDTPRMSAELLVADLDNNGSLDIVADTKNV